MLYESGDASRPHFRFCRLDPRSNSGRSAKVRHRAGREIEVADEALLRCKNCRASASLAEFRIGGRASASLSRPFLLPGSIAARRVRSPDKTFQPFNDLTINVLRRLAARSGLPQPLEVALVGSNAVSKDVFSKTFPMETPL